MTLSRSFRRLETKEWGTGLRKPENIPRAQYEGEVPEHSSLHYKDKFHVGDTTFWETSIRMSSLPSA